MLPGKCLLLLVAGGYQQTAITSPEGLRDSLAEIIAPVAGNAFAFMRGHILLTTRAAFGKLLKAVSQDHISKSPTGDRQLALVQQHLF